MIRLDARKAGRIPDGGRWRAHDRDSSQTKTRTVASTICTTAAIRTGYAYLHPAVDRFSRLAYTKALPNETAATTIRRRARVRTFLAAHGIHRITRVMTDNRSDDRAKNATRTILATAAHHPRIRPHTPNHNGKRSNAKTRPRQGSFSTPRNGPQKHNEPPRSRPGTPTTTTIAHILRSGTSRRPHASTLPSPNS
jgi:hypothetical protein